MLTRRKRMRPRSSSRSAKAKRAAKFGPQAELCRRTWCCVCWAEAEAAEGRSVDGRLGELPTAEHRVSDPHHEPPGSDDSRTGPLCRRHHDERHRVGVVTFWASKPVDPEQVVAEMQRRAA